MDNTKTVSKKPLLQVTSFGKLALAWLIVLLLIRLLETAYTLIYLEFDGTAATVVFKAILLDIVFWSGCLLPAFAFYLLIAVWNERLAKVLFRIYIACMLILQVAVTLYFITALVPLGADIYGYSWSDIVQTIGSSGLIRWFPLLIIVLLLFVLFTCFYFFSKKISLPIWAAAALPVFSAVTLLFQVNETLGLRNSTSEFANDFVLNKTGYFLSSTYNYINPQVNETDIYADSYIGDYDTTIGDVVKFNYVDERNFPFLHSNTYPDVLSPYINKAVRQPDIVFIVVEGLGRAFSNEGAYLGNFTPFIDSLASNGLYWKNFLSQGGRTFALLPSLMASLPFSKNGFLEMGEKMPDHLSLYTILKYNGYQTSFYYGGNAAFDNMRLFLERNKTDRIMDQRTFPKQYSKLPAMNGFSWGYTDKALFKHYLNTISNDNKPHLSLILTVATHNPFLIDEEDAYLSRFEKRMTELGMEEQKKDMYRNYKLQYASILYADDALKNFFREYTLRPQYQNTIFIITGDHRLPEIPMSNKIDRYHVPFIIYSPLLKRTALFSSVSSHSDVVPSLLAFLRKQYSMETPVVNSWIGSGLDTARQFRNIHSNPFIQTKTELSDFVLGNYHLNGSTLYQMKDGMEEISFSDKSILNQLKSSFDAFKARNNSLASGKRLIPDSVYLKYTTAKK